MKTNLPRRQELLAAHLSAHCCRREALGLADEPDGTSGAPEALLRQAPFQTPPGPSRPFQTPPGPSRHPHAGLTETLQKGSTSSLFHRQGRTGRQGGHFISRSGQTPRCCLFTAENVTPVTEKDSGLVSTRSQSGVTTRYNRVSRIIL